MHPFDLFFMGGEAIKVIFKLGFISKEGDFRELSESEYEKYRADVGEPEGTMFRFREEKVKVTKEVYAFSEKEKNKMLEAAEVLRKLAENHPSDSDDETLRYLAGAIPYVFSKGSKYEEFARFRPKE